jgi:hypothetical protein
MRKGNHASENRHYGLIDSSMSPVAPLLIEEVDHPIARNPARNLFD